ncbi:MAG: hypothetical protein JF599_00590 [Verrucomicrobia bacterium]|nr:hypothetical protein [Verrucomicrobiota bacterium]
MSGPERDDLNNQIADRTAKLLQQSRELLTELDGQVVGDSAEPATAGGRSAP